MALNVLVAAQSYAMRRKRVDRLLQGRGSEPLPVDVPVGLTIGDSYSGAPGLKSRLGDRLS
jgi:hypothetical protein